MKPEILNDEEIKVIAQEEQFLLICDGIDEFMDIARAIEAAVIGKLCKLKDIVL